MADAETLQHLTDYSYHSAFVVVGPERFELPTPCFVVMRSGLESARIRTHARGFRARFVGAQGASALVEHIASATMDLTRPACILFSSNRL